MSAGIKVQREGFVDYLLSGFAGVATGAQRGITARQERQRQAEVQNALNAFKERELNLAERDAEATKRFRQQQIGVDAFNIISRNKQEGLNRENRLLIEAMRSDKPLSQEDIDIERRGKLADIKKTQAETKEIQDRVTLDRSELTFKESQQTSNDNFRRVEIQAEYAFKVYEAENAAGIEKYKAAVKELMAKDDIHKFTEKYMNDVGFWNYMAMSATTDAEKKNAVAARDMADKLFAEAASTFDGIEYKSSKLTFERTGIPGLRRIPLIGGLFGGTKVESEGEAGFTVPPEQQRELPDIDPTQRSRELGGFLNQLFGGGFVLPEQPAAQAQQELVGPPVAPQAETIPEPPSGNKPAPIIKSVVEQLKAQGIKSLNKQNKEDFKADGWTDEEIKFVEKQIK